MVPGNAPWDGKLVSAGIDRSLYIFIRLLRPQTTESASTKSRREMEEKKEEETVVDMHRKTNNGKTLINSC